MCTPERPYTMYCGTNMEKKLWMTAFRKAIAAVLGVPETEIGMMAARCSRVLNATHIAKATASPLGSLGRRGRLAHQAHVCVQGRWRLHRRLLQRSGAFAVLGAFLFVNLTRLWLERAERQRPQRYGRGKYVWASKTVYDGAWVDDRRCGHGVMLFHSGEKYEGEWLDDQPRTCDPLALCAVRGYGRVTQLGAARACVR